MGIGISEHRLKHSLGVARFMYEKAIELNPGNEDYAREMFTLGFNHDIGYEFTDNKTEHPKIGGEMLKNSGYKYWKEVYYHGSIDTDYHSQELDLLNESDLSISSSGERVGVELRLANIIDRYGINSSQYIKSKIIAERLGML